MHSNLAVFKETNAIMMTLITIAAITLPPRAVQARQAEEPKARAASGVPTLSAFVQSLSADGTVEVNGVDTQRPDVPFGFAWGDRSTSSGFFPQKHLYRNPNRNYVITITATEKNGSTQSFSLPVFFVTDQEVQVLGAQPWTDTGVDVRVGDVFIINATGGIQFSVGAALRSPNGDSVDCRHLDADIARWTFPNPDVPCHSLIGRIGSSGAIFEVGSSGRFRFPVSGRLFLGVNDNFFPDNSGSWTAKILSEPRRTIPGTEDPRVGSTIKSIGDTDGIPGNIWRIGAPMPLMVGRPGIAVLEGQIYLVAGGTPNGPVTDTQIYNPAANEWSTGTSLPVATVGGCGAVVKNEFYFIGGDTTGHGTYTGAVWIYSPTTKVWTSGRPMPTARGGAFACVVDDDIIYVMGGYNGRFLNTVEAYNPTTDKWTKEQSMLSAESDIMGGALVDNTIIVANASGGAPDGRIQGYSAAANSWKWLSSDPTTRQGTCVASIGPLLYSAGGYYYAKTFNLTESFSPSKGAWKTLASMPVALSDPAGVAYNGQLYCFGGVDGNGNNVNTVQVYQP